MNNFYQKNTQHYIELELQSRVESASPHELIEMLLAGAKTHIATAKVNIVHNQITNKGEHLGKAINIIEGLRISLNHNAGGEISANLDKLYEYIQQLLLKANLHNDADLLIQANQLLTQIEEAWRCIKIPA